MSSPSVPSRPTLDLRALTPARVALGRSGASLPTKPLLDFTLDHARARDAVHAAFDAQRTIAELGEFGVPILVARSRAADRGDYLRRPDLGRQLEPTCADHLSACTADPGRLVIVIGDGLSPSGHSSIRSQIEILPRV